ASAPAARPGTRTTAAVVTAGAPPVSKTPTSTATLKAPAGTGPAFLIVTCGVNGPGPSGQRPTPVTTRAAYLPVRRPSAGAAGSRTLTVTSWQYQLPEVA